MKVNRVEKHVINKNHSMFKICDKLCFKSKNVYNYANYTIRQEFINNGNWIRYRDLSKIINQSDCFKDLGSNSAQMTLRILDKTWKSFFVSIKDWNKHKEKYLGRPRLPKYKDKNGRFVCTLTNMQTHLKEGYLYFAYALLKPFNNLFKTNVQGKLLQTRIVPHGGCYTLEIVYEKEVAEIKESKESNKIISIDLGVNNFATITNNIGINPIIINGKGIKSYNNYWNKQIAKYRSMAKKVNGLNWTNRLQRLTDKRYNKINYFLHNASSVIIKLCKVYNIDTLVIGYNQEWKQNSSMSKKTNQNFVQIPFYIFLQQLEYKCEDNQIKFIKTEESYTSGTSFLDNELPIKENYDKSRRIKRGLFKSNNDKLINSDVNGSLQIMKKVFPNLMDGIVGLDLTPSVLNL